MKVKLPERMTLRLDDDGIAVVQRWWSLWNAILAVIATVVCFVPYLKGDTEMLWLGGLGLGAATIFIVSSGVALILESVSRSDKRSSIEDGTIK